MTKAKHKIDILSQVEGSAVGTVNGKNFQVDFNVHSKKGYKLSFGCNHEGLAKHPERTAVGMWARDEVGLRKRGVKTAVTNSTS